MNIVKQTVKMTPLTKLLIIFGLILGLWVLYLGTDTANAASKQAENVCKKAIQNTSDARAKRTLRNNLDACYYGFDEVGEAQNFVKKCRNKYPKNNNKQGVCMAGASLAQRVASRAPPIERCEREDIRNTQRCKKEYRRCDKIAGPRIGRVVAQCKRDAINQFRQGGDGSGDGSNELPAIGEAGDYICGTYANEKRNVRTKFNFGCIGTQFAKTGNGQKNLSPIHDLTFAFIRFLSIGVGIVMAISIIMSAIQYSMSEGNAEVTQKAKSRIRSAVMGLAIYIFAFSMLQFLIPGGIFRPGIWVDDNILQLLSRLLL